MAVREEALDPPLRVDWIEADALADGRRGRLGLTFLPGKHGPSFRYPGRVYRRDLDRDLATLREVGVGTLLLLVEDGELARWGHTDIVERAAAAGVEIVRHPIPDGAPPASVLVMDELLDGLADARMRTDVAVACMGGVGRTGTVAACALVRAGSGADDAIARVRDVRHPTAVETEAQEGFVHAYERHVAGADRSGTVPA